MTRLNDQLRRHLDRRGISQAELARRADIRPDALNRSLMHGSHASRMEHLADVLGLDWVLVDPERTIEINGEIFFGKSA